MKSRNDQTAGTGFSSVSGELKRRLIFVLIAVLIYRLGAHIPVAGINADALANLFRPHTGGVFGMFNIFTGGALSRMTIFALGIMPYISSSIIVQLLTAVSDQMKALQQEGEAGRRKINQYTRYGTVLLALCQSIGMATWLFKSGAANIPAFHFYFIVTITLITGTVFLMWLGEQVTERGIGNGITLIIFAGIVSRLPSGVHALFTAVQQGQMQAITLLVVIALVFAVIGFIVFMETAQRRIKIEYAKRQQGRKMYAQQSSHLPLKINMAGVLPVIFAQAMIVVPSFLATQLSTHAGFTWLKPVTFYLQVGQPVYMLLFAFGVIFFAFFYTGLQYNPRDTAKQLKQSGAFLPGIRPGEKSALYIEKVMDRLTVIGSLYLTLVALLPQILVAFWHLPFSFGGTSLLIAVVAVMDFTSQVQTHMRDRWYKNRNRRGLVRQ